MYICVHFHILKQITGRNQTGRMKSIYIGCTAGISGDMLLRALQELARQYEHHKAHQHEHHEGHEHGHGHHHHHGRSYEEVNAIIDRGFYTEKARAYAQSIYAVIAKAEAAVIPLFLFSCFTACPHAYLNLFISALSASAPVKIDF